MFSLSVWDLPVSVLPSASTTLCVSPHCLYPVIHFRERKANHDHEQNGPSWLIVDSGDKAGGLAATDVTPEGFVSFPDPSGYTRIGRG